MSNNSDTTTRRPVAVSSTSSLDSSATAAQYQQSTGDQQGVVNSSTLDDKAFANALNHPNTFLFSEEDTSPLLNPSVAPVSSSNSVAAVPVPIMPLATAAAPAAPVPNANTVPEFLYQLTKMLTDNNREIIEWSNGRIEVHSPHRLQSEVLNNYFRHSKFASFQRQLNYFGFRKLAGKGKMAPCSYVNDAATRDLSSLLLIKRKSGATGPPATEKPAPSRKRDRTGPSSLKRQSSTSAGTRSSRNINPVLKGILDRSQKDAGTTSVASTKIAVGKGVKHQLNGYLKNQGGNLPTSNDHKALARAAAGKGVRHGYLSATATNNTSMGAASSALDSSLNSMPFADSQVDIQSSLSELTNNYKNSLKEASQAIDAIPDDPAQNLLLGPTGSLGFLSRDSSLVNLAMLPMGEESEAFEPTPVSEMRDTLMPFVDFPQLDSSSASQP